MGETADPSALPRLEDWSVISRHEGTYLIGILHTEDGQEIEFMTNPIYAREPNDVVIDVFGTRIPLGNINIQIEMLHTNAKQQFLDMIQMVQ